MIYGKRATGKTTLIDHILSKSNPMCSLIFSNSKEYDKYTESKTSYVEIFQDFDSTKLRDHLDYFQLCASVYNVNSRGNLVVLDDSVVTVKNDTQLKWLFLNGRFIQTGLILTNQGGYNLPTALRQNIDYVFIFRDRDVRRLYEQYAGIFPTIEQFQSTLEKYTNNYGCLVIDNTSNSNQLEDRIFHYKVPRV